MLHTDVDRIDGVCGGACPEQYEGFLRDGRPFYFRYRHGYARLDIGRQGQTYPDRDTCLSAGMPFGDDLAGCFPDDVTRDHVFSLLYRELSRGSECSLF